MRSFIFCGETETESDLRSECWMERIAARQNCRASCGESIRLESGVRTAVWSIVPPRPKASRAPGAVTARRFLAVGQSSL